MRPLYYLSAAALLFVGSAIAEDQEKKIDLEGRKQSVAILSEHIAEREIRLREIASDIIRLDLRLEGQIDRVVKKLASVKDSQKSGYRVSQVKMEAMEGLGKTIANYRSKRATLVQEIREKRSGIPQEVLDGDIKVFDQHVEKRVEQILELSKSFTQDADVEKYERVHGDPYYRYGYGWSDEIRQISEEWRQNRRDRTMDKKQRREILEALKKSIERLEAHIAGQKDSLGNRKMSKTESSLMQSEMDRNKALLELRNGQLHELLEIDTPSTEAVDRDAAQDLQHALRDSTADMRQDFEAIFVKYGELNRERAKFFKLKKDLEAREAWIKDYEEKQSKK